MAKGRNPRIAAIISAKLRGTSSDTTSSVRAKPNTTSQNASSRVISPPRQRKYFSGSRPRRCSEGNSWGVAMLEDEKWGDSGLFDPDEEWRSGLRLMVKDSDDSWTGWQWLIVRGYRRAAVDGSGL